MSRKSRARKTLPAVAAAGGRPMPGANAGEPGEFWSAGGYMRGETGPTFANWYPSPRDPSDEVRSAYVRAAGRANDIIHNSGWLTGAIDQAVANTVGTGLRLRCLPDAAALGWTEDEATDWAATVEDRFALWAGDPMECDIEGRSTFGQMQAAAFRAWFGPGEILSESAFKRRPGCTYGTKVRLIPPHRLSQRTAAPRLVQGVQMDADWMPTSYWFWRRDNPIGAEQEVEIEARNNRGRPRIVHVFDRVPGQFRGISPLVAALETARKFDQLAQATLTANLIRAVFAATITSDEPTEEVIKGFLTPAEQARMESENLSPFDCYAGMMSGWYRSNAQINLGVHGRFAHLFPGQKMELHGGQDRPGDYREMTLVLLREIMRCLGLTYESGTGDYSGATYASVNNATGEIFQITLYRRRNIIAPFCAPHFQAWLEEDIAAGRTPFPGGLAAFYRQRAAASRHEWVGAPKPQADALKQQKAHEGYRNMGVVSDEMICADLGVDVHDVYKQRAREMKLRQKLGLPEAGPIEPDPVADKLATAPEPK
jgi:lambda family phage portal protein